MRAGTGTTRGRRGRSASASGRPRRPARSTRRSARPTGVSVGRRSGARRVGDSRDDLHRARAGADDGHPLPVTSRSAGQSAVWNTGPWKESRPRQVGHLRRVEQTDRADHDRARPSCGSRRPDRPALLVVVPGRRIDLDPELDVLAQAEVVGAPLRCSRPSRPACRSGWTSYAGRTSRSTGSWGCRRPRPGSGWSATRRRRRRCVPGRRTAPRLAVAARRRPCRTGRRR